MRIKRLIELINTFTRYNQMDPDRDEDNVDVCCPGRNMTGEITVEEFGHETLEKLLTESTGDKNTGNRKNHKKVTDTDRGNGTKNKGEENDKRKQTETTQVKKYSERLQKETPEWYRKNNEERYILGFDDYMKLVENKGTSSNVQSYFGKLATGSTDYDREEDDCIDEEE